MSLSSLHQLLWKDMDRAVYQIKSELNTNGREWKEKGKERDGGEEKATLGVANKKSIHWDKRDKKKKLIQGMG